VGGGWQGGWHAAELQQSYWCRAACSPRASTGPCPAMVGLQFPPAAGASADGRLDRLPCRFGTTSVLVGIGSRRVPGFLLPLDRESPARVRLRQTNALLQPF